MNGTEISRFFYDAKWFILQNRDIVNNAPLQPYCSVIIFSPETSVIRNTFKGQKSRWLYGLPKVQSNWNLQLQILEGHGRCVNVIIFSLNGSLLASTDDCTIRLWDPTTGQHKQTLEGHGHCVRDVIFSADGRLLASASIDCTVRLWDPAAGEHKQTLKSAPIFTELCFSSNNHYLYTDNGILCLSSGSISPPSPSLTLPHNISVQENWIAKNNEKLLWLPYDY